MKGQLGSWEIANSLDNVTTEMVSYELKMEGVDDVFIRVTGANARYLDFIDSISHAVEVLREQIKFQNTIDIYR